MSRLPKTPIKGDAETRRFLESVRQTLTEVEVKAVTVADMREPGFFDKNNISVPVDTKTPGVGGPTIPTTLEANGAFENIILTWNYVDYAGHAHTRIYRNTVDNFSTAQVLANVDARVYADPVGAGAVFYYWVTNVNVNGLESAPNQVAGTKGETALDTAYILTLLTNSITESQLFTSLAERINLIDGSISLPGSVNARLSAAQTALQTQIAANGSAIVSLQTADATQATQITTLGTRVGTAESNITSLQATTASQATSINTLNTTVSGNSTSIQTLQTTTNGLSGQYTVKIDSNGYVSGFGLASTPINGTPFSSFIVRADNFSIASPSGPGITPVVPFIVRTTSSTVNGVTVPVGIYMDGAYIQNGSITNAKIGNAAIDDAKIANLSAGKITTGSLDASRVTIDDVTLDTYYDSSIGRNRLKIKNLGVDTAQIATAAIKNAKIDDLTIGTEKVQDLAITRASSFFYNYNGWSYPTNYVWYDLAPSGGGYLYVGTGNGDYEYDYFYETYTYVGPGNGSYTYSAGTSGLSTSVTTSSTIASGVQSVHIDASLVIQRDGGSDDDIRARCVRTNDSTVLTEYYDKLRARSGNSTYALFFRDQNPIPGVLNTYKIQFYNQSDNSHFWECNMRATLYRK